MTDLRQRMHETVDHESVDLVGLTTAAASRGARLRRRRRVAVVGASLAVLAVVGAGVAVTGGAVPDRAASVPAAGHGGPDVALDPTTSPSPPAPLPPTPATGRTTVAALYAAVTDVLPGSGTDFVGQGPAGGAPDTYGELAFTPADGSGAGRIGINLQAKSILADPETGLSAEEGFVCLDFMEACTVSTLADGSLLRTYAEHSAAAGGGTGERLVAERLVGGLRVVAGAENGFEGPSNQWDITRSDAVLSIDQLTRVVSQPWWGFDLPGEYAAELDVPTYTEIPTM